MLFLLNGVHMKYYVIALGLLLSSGLHAENFINNAIGKSATVAVQAVIYGMDKAKQQTIKSVNYSVSVAAGSTVSLDKKAGLTIDQKQCVQMVTITSVIPTVSWSTTAICSTTTPDSTFKVTKSTTGALTITATATSK